MCIIKYLVALNHSDIKIEVEKELKKRYRNRRRTLHRDFLRPCLITHAHSYSKSISIIH